MSVPAAPTAALDKVLKHPASSRSLSSRGEVAGTMTVLLRAPLSHRTGYRPVMAAGTAPGERAEA